MINRLFVFTLFLQLYFSTAFGQAFNFRSPLDIPSALSANFGELRTDRFHLGLDFKTQGQTGKTLYAIADGYISRVKISTSSYGNALYITHKNGYTSLYGHIESYSPTIAKYIDDYQYRNKTHVVDLYFEPQQFTVKQGEVVGLSGNTGYSFGPHLHFEIRDQNQVPLNLLKFKTNIVDKTPPQIKNIAIYPQNSMSAVNGKNEKLIIPVIWENGKYKLSNNDSIFVMGTIGFGVEAYDYLDAATNQCGNYSVELLFDTNSVYLHQLDKISFAQARYMNSFIDYQESLLTSRKLQKSFVAPNNQLPIYKSLVNNGLLSIQNDTAIKVNYVIKDVYNNTAKISFNVFGKVFDSVSFSEPENIVMRMFYDVSNTFEQSGLKIQLPAMALYENIDFTFKITEQHPLCISKTYNVHSRFTPVHFYYELSVDTVGLQLNNPDKTVFVVINENGKSNGNGKKQISSLGGDFINGKIVTKIAQFGKFALALDTIPPIVDPLFVNNSNLSDKKNLSFTIKDELTGIKSYIGYIDGEWALFEYDLKNDLLIYNLKNNRIAKGNKHTYEVVIIDGKNNSTTRKGEFIF